jgi:hypothetical protein
VLLACEQAFTIPSICEALVYCGSSVVLLLLYLLYVQVIIYLLMGTYCNVGGSGPCWTGT